MKTIKVDRFTIEISDPYPVWVRIARSDSGGGSSVIGSFDHRELRDLEYAVGRAIHAARAELPEKFKVEMD